MYTERELYLPHQEQIYADKLGITLQFRDYTIDRLGVMTQKAEKMLLEVINEWLCNVQLFRKVWILEIFIKAFRISGSESGSRLKAVFGYPYPVATHYPASYPTGKPDSDHLWDVHREEKTRKVNIHQKYRELQNTRIYKILFWISQMLQKFRIVYLFHVGGVSSVSI